MRIIFPASSLSLSNPKSPTPPAHLLAAYMGLKCFILDFIDQGADLVDLDPDVTAVLEDDTGFAEEADSRGRAGEEDGACF